MSYMTIVAVVEVSDEVTQSSDEKLLEVASFCFKIPQLPRFLAVERGVTATAIMEGADPSLWPEGTEKGTF